MICVYKICMIQQKSILNLQSLSFLQSPSPLDHQGFLQYPVQLHSQFLFTLHSLFPVNIMTITTVMTMTMMMTRMVMMATMIKILLIQSLMVEHSLGFLLYSQMCADVHLGIVTKCDISKCDTSYCDISKCDSSYCDIR